MAPAGGIRTTRKLTWNAMGTASGGLTRHGLVGQIRMTAEGRQGPLRPGRKQQSQVFDVGSGNQAGQSLRQ